jgi:hypothetical protein
MLTQSYCVEDPIVIIKTKMNEILIRTYFILAIGTYAFVLDVFLFLPVTSKLESLWIHVGISLNLWKLAKHRATFVKLWVTSFACLIIISTWELWNKNEVHFTIFDDVVKHIFISLIAIEVVHRTFRVYFPHMVHANITLLSSLSWPIILNAFSLTEVVKLLTCKMLLHNPAHLHYLHHKEHNKSDNRYLGHLILLFWTNSSDRSVKKNLNFS